MQIPACCCGRRQRVSDRISPMCKHWLCACAPFLPSNVEVMVYQYDRFFGYGYWMTSIPTITHILIFCCILLGYCNIWIGRHANQLGNSKYPKNIEMWVMVRILVIHQPYPKSLSYWYTITSTLCSVLPIWPGQGTHGRRVHLGCSQGTWLTAEDSCGRGEWGTWQGYGVLMLSNLSVLLWLNRWFILLYVAWQNIWVWLGKWLHFDKYCTGHHLQNRYGLKNSVWWWKTRWLAGGCFKVSEEQNKEHSWLKAVMAVGILINENTWGNCSLGLEQMTKKASWLLE